MNKFWLLIATDLNNLLKYNDSFDNFFEGHTLRVDGHDVAGVHARPRLGRGYTQRIHEEQIGRPTWLRVLQHREQVRQKLVIQSPDLKFCD